MAEIIGKYIQVGPYRTYYESAGEGRPILCFPTAGAPATEYHYFLEYFGDRGYRAIAVDPPGHGHSFPNMEDLSTPATVPEYADYIWQVVQSLGLERPAIVGCAMTGSILLQVAIDHSSEIGAMIAAEGNSRFKMDMKLLMLNHPGVNTEDIMEIGTPALSGAGLSRRALNECIWHNARAAIPEIYQTELTIYDQFDVSDRIGEITCPLLHIYGSDDPSVTPFSVEDIRQKIPGVTQVLVPGMGHLAPLDDPASFNREVEAFLAEHYPATAL